MHIFECELIFTCGQKSFAMNFFSCGLNNKIKPQQLGTEFSSVRKKMTDFQLIIDTGYL